MCNFSYLSPTFRNFLLLFTTFAYLSQLWPAFHNFIWLSQLSLTFTTLPSPLSAFSEDAAARDVRGGLEPPADGKHRRPVEARPDLPQRQALQRGIYATSSWYLTVLSYISCSTRLCHQRLEPSDIKDDCKQVIYQRAVWWFRLSLCHAMS